MQTTFEDPAVFCRCRKVSLLVHDQEVVVVIALTGQGYTPVTGQENSLDRGGVFNQLQCRIVELQAFFLVFPVNPEQWTAASQGNGVATCAALQGGEVQRVGECLGMRVAPDNKTGWFIFFPKPAQLAFFIWLSEPVFSKCPALRGFADALFCHGGFQYFTGYPLGEALSRNYENGTCDGEYTHRSQFAGGTTGSQVFTGLAVAAFDITVGECRQCNR